MDWFYGILIDIILLAIVIIVAKLGAKQGFAKAVVGFASVVIAFVLAMALCKPVSNLVYESVAEPSLVEGISESIEEKIDKSAPGQSKKEMLAAMKEYVDSLPGFVKDAVDTKDLSAAIDDAADKEKAGIDAISKEICDATFRPIVVTLVSVFIFSIIFIIMGIVTKIVAKALKIVNKIPVLGTVNQLLGGVIGALKGIVIVLVINWAVTSIVGDSSSLFGFITPNVIDSSLIMKGIGLVNPIGALLGSVAK